MDTSYLITFANMFDRKYFPGPRERFLKSWMTQGHSFSLAYLDGNNLKGYGVIRQCLEGYKIGPLFAETDVIATTLFEGLVSKINKGPVFFVYKILQTIKTAAFLKQNFSKNNFVPVFWMATEDHDFEEINHFKTKHNYFEIKGKSGGVVGKIKIEDLVFISAFEEEFKDDIFGTELILLLKKAYKKGEDLTSATRFFVNELFSNGNSNPLTIP